MMILDTVKKFIPQKLINYGYHLPKALLSVYRHGNPAKGLEVIAVTGTDGKTTTVSLIHHILKISRRSSALISTVSAQIGRQHIDTGFHVTSPDPDKLQALLKRIRGRKIKYVCLEATSHGLDQFRLQGINPAVAVLTNISHEHLDYHKSLDSYRLAKLRLFRAARYAVLNKDDETFTFFKEKLKKPSIVTYSVSTPSQMQPVKIQFLKTKTKFTVGAVQYEMPLLGRYNLYNALAAISVAMVLEIPPSDIRRALLTFPGVRGRFESIPNRKGVNVIVDFAHTPNALENVLTLIKSKRSPSAKTIAVFGAAGLRDRSKRPLMGEVAARLSDEVVLTAEDPRTENLDNIIAAIKEGIPKDYSSKVHEIPDRQEAISYAINSLAKPGDYVGIFGKGHETTMCFGSREMSWSDQGAVKQALGEQ